MGYYAIEDETEDLQHHGIKGQKWGVRRFQRPDGTRTPAGKARERENYNYDSTSTNTSSDGVQNGGPKKKFDKEKAKKIAKGVAIGVGAAALTYGAAKWAKEYHDMPDFLKKELKSAGKEKIKDIEKAAKKRLIRAGDAMIDAALISVGSIAISKVLKKLDPGENASQLQKDASKVAGDTISAGIRTVTNPSGKHINNSNNKNNSSNSNLKVDKNSKEYQNLFSGLDDNNAREEIKKRANNGATLEELQEYRRSIKHSEFEDWASKYMGVEIGR